MSPLKAENAGGPAAAKPVWLGSWGASPVFAVGPELCDQTVRQFVRLSIGGGRVRIRLSNETSTQKLVIGAARVVVVGGDGVPQPLTERVVTFGGQPGMTIPAGAPAVSDAVELEVKALDTLAVSLFFPRWTGPAVIHWSGMQTALISTPGDFTGAAELKDATTSMARIYLSGVEVEAAAKTGGAAGTVVAFGDSITDGYGSTPDRNRRWPDFLAARFAREAGAPRLGVVNAGLSGNRLLHDQPSAEFGPNALSRFDRDVLAVPGVTHVVVLEGVNDIGAVGSSRLPEQAVTVDEIIAALRQLIDRAHGRGIKIYGATYLPFEGTTFARYYSEEGEAKRQAVNQWIRTGGAFDGVIDFDALTRDPSNPARLRPEFDSGDHLHPNDLGYEAMANAINLGWFR